MKRKLKRDMSAETTVHLVTWLEHWAGHPSSLSFLVYKVHY